MIKSSTSPFLPGQMAETQMRLIHGSGGFRGEGGIEGFRSSNDQFPLTFRGVRYKQQPAVFPNQVSSFNLRGEED